MPASNYLARISFFSRTITIRIDASSPIVALLAAEIKAKELLEEWMERTTTCKSGDLIARIGGAAELFSIISIEIINWRDQHLFVDADVSGEIFPLKS